MVNYQSSTLALRAIESILAQEEEDFKLEVVVVDNCSEDSEKEILRQADLSAHVKRFFLPQNIGYGMGNNFAFEPRAMNEIRSAVAPIHLQAGPIRGLCETNSMSGSISWIAEYVNLKKSFGKEW